MNFFAVITSILLFLRVKGQEIASPNPSSVGGALRVRCAVDTSGGRESPGNSRMRRQRVDHIAIYWRHPGDGDFRVLASYSRGQSQEKRTELIAGMKATIYQSINTSACRVHLTVMFEKSTCDLQAMYKCVFRRRSKTGIVAMEFEETASYTTDTDPVLHVEPEMSKSEVGQNITFICKVRSSDRNKISLKWMELYCNTTVEVYKAMGRHPLSSWETLPGGECDGANFECSSNFSSSMSRDICWVFCHDTAGHRTERDIQSSGNFSQVGNVSEDAGAGGGQDNVTTDGRDDAAPDDSSFSWPLALTIGVVMGFVAGTLWMGSCHRWGGPACRRCRRWWRNPRRRHGDDIDAVEQAPEPATPKPPLAVVTKSLSVIFVEKPGGSKYPSFQSSGSPSMSRKPSALLTSRNSIHNIYIH